MFHIYAKITKPNVNYMVIDDVALTYDYMDTLDANYDPNDLQDFASSFHKFLEYLITKEDFLDRYAYLVSVSSLHNLPSLYPELFI